MSPTEGGSRHELLQHHTELVDMIFVLLIHSLCILESLGELAVVVTDAASNHAGTAEGSSNTISPRHRRRLCRPIDYIRDTTAIGALHRC